MDFTPFIAIYGAVVATAGAIIQYNNYKATKAKLLIKIDTKSYSYFFKTKEFGMDSYQSDYSAVISMKISNTSSLPITIDDAYVHNETLDKGYHDSFEIRLKECETKKNGKTFWRSYPPSKSLQLPFRIEPYDTVYASVRIPFISDAIVDNKIKSLEITLETPRQNYSYTVTLFEYDVLHEQYLLLEEKQHATPPLK